MENIPIPPKGSSHQPLPLQHPLYPDQHSHTKPIRQPQISLHPHSKRSWMVVSYEFVIERLKKLLPSFFPQKVCQTREVLRLPESIYLFSALKGLPDLCLRLPESVWLFSDVRNVSELLRKIRSARQRSACWCIKTGCVVQTICSCLVRKGWSIRG
jgi:hypothetical protein